MYNHLVKFILRRDPSFMDTFKVDKVGYERLKAEIEVAEKHLQEIRDAKAEQQCGTTYDAIWSNPILFQLAAQEEQAINRLNDLKHKMKNAEIVESEKVANCINLGSVVHLVIFPDLSLTVKLVSNSPKDGEISLESPLGQAIYGKKCDDVVSYMVSGRSINRELKAKVISID